MRARIEKELTQLREHYPEIEHQEHAEEDWFHIPNYSFPPGWSVDGTEIAEAPIVFKIVASYPTGEPYGFSAPAGISFNGTPPNKSSLVDGVPFEGSWHQFSWAPEDWAPTNNALKGANLLAWVRSFTQRLKEGA